MHHKMRENKMRHVIRRKGILITVFKKVNKKLMLMFHMQVQYVSLGQEKLRYHSIIVNYVVKEPFSNKATVLHKAYEFVLQVNKKVYYSFVSNLLSFLQVSHVISSVSYTHLDVYKRQIQYYIYVHKTRTRILQHIQHRDVYKRQNIVH